MSKKLTPWFPMSVKPVRDGVYNVSCRSSAQTGLWYAYWNGEVFGFYGRSPAGVPAGGHEPFDCTLSWRGLAKKP